MSSRTRLEAMAHNAQDMTVADVHTVLAALHQALAEIQRAGHGLVVAIEVADGVDAALAEARKVLRRRYRGRLPESELQVTPTGRRMRVTVREWGDWTYRLYESLFAVLVVLDSVSSSAGQELFLVHTVQAVKAEVEAREYEEAGRSNYR